MDSDYEVQRILREKNFYKMLKVDKTATDEEIKRAYRKLASVVHPDRCHNEKATEAFQNISHAYRILIDPAARNHYNNYGSAPQQSNEQYQARQRFREKIDPNIYDFMFGNVRYHRPRPQQKPREDNQFDFFFPILFILFFFFLIGSFSIPSLSGLFSNLTSRSNLKGIISFDKSEVGPSSTQRTSNKYNVKYFIPNWWIQDNKHLMTSTTLYKIDSVADELYKEELNIKCELEKNTLNREGPQCSKKQTIIGTR